MKPFKHIVGASAWIAAIFVGLLLVSCGGSGGGAAGPGDSDFATRQAIMNRAISDASSLTYENFATEAPGVVNQIRSRSEFKDVYVDRDGEQVIWAEFVDGRLLAINRNRRLDPNRGSRTSSTSNRPGQTPTGRSPFYDIQPSAKAALFFSFGSEGMTNIAQTVRNGIQQLGYEIHPGTTGTLEDYKSLQDVSLLYVDSHGLLSGGGVSIQSGSIVSAELDELYKEELKTQELFAVSSSTNEPQRYAFTAAWAKKYIRLSPGAFVFANTCNSQANSTLSDALAENGMGAMLGWTRPVGDPACADTAFFFFDHAIGKPEYFTYMFSGDSVAEPTKPLAWGEIISTMQSTTRIKNPFDRDGSKLSLIQDWGNCRLVATGVVRPENTLRPVIKELFANEDNGTIVLSGRFSSNPGTVTAKTAGGSTSIPVAEWTYTAITIPWDIDYQSFEVVANGMKSNEFDWSLVEYRLKSQAGGPITLKNEVTMWVSDQQVYSGTGINAGPIVFQGKPGALLRIQVRRNGSATGSVSAFLDSPETADYQVVPAQIDLLFGTNGVIWDRTYLLQP